MRGCATVTLVSCCFIFYLFVKHFFEEKYKYYFYLPSNLLISKYQYNFYLNDLPYKDLTNSFPVGANG